MYAPKWSTTMPARVELTVQGDVRHGVEVTLGGCPPKTLQSLVLCHQPCDVVIMRQIAKRALARQAKQNQVLARHCHYCPCRHLLRKNCQSPTSAAPAVEASCCAPPRVFSRKVVLGPMWPCVWQSACASWTREPRGPPIRTTCG